MVSSEVLLLQMEGYNILIESVLYVDNKWVVFNG